MIQTGPGMLVKNQWGAPEPAIVQALYHVTAWF